MKAILTIGPPGCGKSTWALEQVQIRISTFGSENPESSIYISERDAYRSGYYAKGESKSDSLEKKVSQRQFEDFLEVIKSGSYDTIIVSDTNINPKTRQKLESFFKENNVEVEYKIFLDCDYETISARNKLRKGWQCVPEKVMQDMYIRFREQFPKPALAYDPTLPDCYLCDIDGTVAKMNGRFPFDWKRVDEDLPNKDVINLIQDIQTFTRVIYLSGRDGSCYDKTVDWIYKHINEASIGMHAHLYMRPEGNNLKDSCVKHDLYHKHIAGNYNVLGVFDDRQAVVDMWRSMGLRCYQVAPGNF